MLSPLKRGDVHRTEGFKKLSHNISKSPYYVEFPLSNPSMLRTRPLKKGTTLGVEGLKKLILNIFLFRQVFAPDNRTPQNFQIAEL